MSATCNARSAQPEARMVSAVALVTANERIGGGCHRIVADVQGAWPECGPGQFAMLSLDHPRFPTLPRPFSLLGWQRRDGRDELEWMVMPVGVGTGLLCSARPGDALDVVGPLGRRTDAGLPDGPLVCVGGGYGIAPFVFLTEAWRRQADPRADSATVIYGARTAERLALVERLQRTGCRIETCTDDSSAGHAGRVDARLREVLAGQPCGMVLTCGPEAMMEAVGSVCRELGVPARASLETVMGCGYAVCNGCAVAVSDGRQPDGYTYELACREGTVFDETRLLWHQP
jgi:dihydroorotate dehydrogenase electron transfer subunit